MQPKASRRDTPRPSLRVAQKEDTRRRLLISARKLFRAQGVEPVSMEDVANAAEVSRATVYLHFAGKPALLEALLEEDWAAQVRLFERLRDVDVSNAERLNEWIMRVAVGMIEARDSFGIHRAALGHNPQLIEGHQQHRRRLAEILLLAVDGKPAEIGNRRRRDVEVELIVAELEYFGTAAALDWTGEEVALGTALVRERLQEFARCGG